MEALCKTCKHCTKYRATSEPKVLNIKTTHQVENNEPALPFDGMVGGKCSLLDFYIIDVQECDCYEPKESN